MSFMMSAAIEAPSPIMKPLTIIVMLPVVINQGVSGKPSSKTK